MAIQIATKSLLLDWPSARRIPDSSREVRSEHILIELHSHRRLRNPRPGSQSAGNRPVDNCLADIQTGRTDFGSHHIRIPVGRNRSGPNRSGPNRAGSDRNSVVSSNADYENCYHTSDEHVLRKFQM